MPESDPSSGDGKGMKGKMYSRSLTGTIQSPVLIFGLLKAKFHYAS